MTPDEKRKLMERFMDQSILAYERAKKYNNWGEKRPIICTDTKKIESAMIIAINKNLSDDEQSVKYVHSLTDCHGFEFVLFSNAKIDKFIRLTNNVILYPCFLPTTEGLSLDESKVKASFSMYQKGKYVYDGWMPISSMSDESMLNNLRALNETLSTFSFVLNSKFEWIPKYRLLSANEPTHYVDQEDISTIENFANTIDAAAGEDKMAIYRSVGWLSQGFKLSHPEAKFLFSILAIESLCNYIEEDADENSAFIKLRGVSATKTEKMMVRNKCIEETLLKLIDTDPTKAISKAYFDCVVGIKRRMREHLARVMSGNDEDLLLFFGNGEKSGLYDLRHKIAHGTHDVINLNDRMVIQQNLPVLQRFALRYLWEILHKAFNIYNIKNTRKASIGIGANQAILSNPDMYKGPVDMAILYAD